MTTISTQSYTKLTQAFGCAATSLQERPDLLDQVTGGERLGHVEIRPHTKALVHLHVAALRREHDHLHACPLGPLADALAHLVAALHRHHDVEQHEIGRIAFDRL